MARWRVNQTAVTQACKILGLHHPVTIRLYDADWWGTYAYDPLHTVWVNKTIKHPIDASETIWHELVHALQCERDFASDGVAYRRAAEYLYAPFMDDDGNCLWDAEIETYDGWLERYFANPLEEEAETLANRYGARYPLVQ